MKAYYNVEKYQQSTVEPLLNGLPQSFLAKFRVGNLAKLKGEENLLVDWLSQKIQESLLIPVEASGRHVHLSREDVARLFGKDYQLTELKNLSQSGQFTYQERVTLVGPKGSLENVAILGPPRIQSQVEISLTDCKILGVAAPLRESGKLAASAPIIIKTAQAELNLFEGLIVAMRHLHISPSDAEKFRVRDGEIIRLKVFSARPLIFDEVLVRINPDFSTVVHLDYDEANACGYDVNTKALVIKKTENEQALSKELPRAKSQAAMGALLQ